MPKKKQVAAMATIHCQAEKVKCRGALIRTNDGADRLSEYNNRIVVKCDQCGATLSLSTKG